MPRACFEQGWIDMMLKLLFQSWFKRHEHKHEEVPMSDSPESVQVTPAVSQQPQSPESVQVTPVEALTQDVVNQVSNQVGVRIDGQIGGDLTEEQARDAQTFIDHVEKAGTEHSASHEAFAEKLHHLLRLAGVEVDHLWDEAVALAKKLV